ncbi:MAG: HNH endonuclease [Bacteroidales bacterium]|nr:HNH endonuclease [Bacteroidales bacterium]MCF8326931.1 HNH endonuclease [Bacteroidales bacterium]
MLNEPEHNYARKVKRQIEEQHTDAREEFVVIRNAKFREVIMEIYGNQCAVTGLKVEYRNQKPLLDACHIIPFAESYNDSVRNGIAMSPTFHRAFDSGAISISADYRVLVHPALRDQSPFHSLRQYEQQEIILPAEEKYFPSAEYLSKHRRKNRFEC